MFEDKKYLRRLGVHHITITAVEKKEAGSARGFEWGPSVQVVCEAEDGALINAKFKTPFTDPKNKYEKQRFDELLALAGTKKPSELIGKKLLIVVVPKSFNGGKPYWKVEGFYDPSLLLPPGAALDSLLDDVNGLTGAKDEPKEDEIEW